MATHTPTKPSKSKGRGPSGSRLRPSRVASLSFGEGDDEHTMDNGAIAPFAAAIDAPAAVMAATIAAAPAPAAAAAAKAQVACLTPGNLEEMAVAVVPFVVQLQESNDVDSPLVEFVVDPAAASKHPDSKATLKALFGMMRALSAAAVEDKANPTYSGELSSCSGPFRRELNKVAYQHAMESDAILNNMRDHGAHNPEKMQVAGDYFCESVMVVLCHTAHSDKPEDAWVTYPSALDTRVWAWTNQY
jgi:hypothetical protein